jgi:glucose-6-phosphate 1-epimerase
MSHSTAFTIALLSLNTTIDLRCNQDFRSRRSHNSSMQNPQTLDELNASFAISGVLAFDQHPDATGLIRARITTTIGTADLYLQGAHVAAWQPAGEQPVLFLSERSLFTPGKAIRGGIPIIFPWFGSRTATQDSPRTDGPSHGFARTELWQLDFATLTDDNLHLSLSLAPNDRSRSLGFDNFRLAYQLTLGRDLHLRLMVANDGPAPLHIEEAFHTYLHVGDVEQVQVHGLANTEYLDKTDDLRRKRQYEQFITPTAETDRLYLNTPSPITLDDPTLHRRLTLTKANSSNTVLWNPWSTGTGTLPDMTPDGWRSMLCIETANANENALVLHPHETHVMETTISITNH